MKDGALADRQAHALLAFLGLDFGAVHRLKIASKCTADFRV